MYVVLVNFTIHADHVDEFRERVRQQAQDSLDNEPECHVFDVCIDPDNPAEVMLYEVYSHADAFAVHLASDHFRDFDATVKNWVSDKRLSFFEKI